MKKDNFLTKVSTEEQDFNLMKPFLTKDKNLMLWMVKTMKQLRRNASETENRVGKYMYLQRIIFIPQAPFLIPSVEGDRYYFADFYIPAINTIIEIDGKEHNTREHKIADIQRDNDFERIGIKTIRIPSKAVWNKEYKKMIPSLPEKLLRPIKMRIVSSDTEMREKEEMLRRALIRKGR